MIDQHLPGVVTSEHDNLLFWSFHLSESCQRDRSGMPTSGVRLQQGLPIWISVVLWSIRRFFIFRSISIENRVGIAQGGWTLIHRSVGSEWRWSVGRRSKWWEDGFGQSPPNRSKHHGYVCGKGTSVNDPLITISSVDESLASFTTVDNIRNKDAFISIVPEILDNQFHNKSFWFGAIEIERDCWERVMNDKLFWQRESLSFDNYLQLSN